MLRVIYGWLYIFIMYLISSAQAYEEIHIGNYGDYKRFGHYYSDYVGRLLPGQLGFRYSHINGFELSGKKLVEKMIVNGTCDKNVLVSIECPEQRGEMNLILGKNEFINEIEYQWNMTINYLSFRTNKGQFIEAGQRMNETLLNMLPISPNWGYGRLHNIQVFEMRLEAGEYVWQLGHMEWLDVYYNYLEPTLKIKDSKVYFIASIIPPEEDMAEYEDPHQRLAEAYQEIYKHLTTDIIKKQFVEKVNVDDFEISTEEDGRVSFLRKKNKSQHKPTSKVKIYTIPKDHIGVKLGVAELMVTGYIHWLFPKSVTSHLVINRNDISKILGFYAMKGTVKHELFLLMPNFIEYLRYQKDTIHFPDRLQKYPYNTTKLGRIHLPAINTSLYIDYFTSDYNLNLGPYTTDITIKGKSIKYGEAIDQDYIPLDTDEFVNEIEYCHTDTQTYDIKYISFCTNKLKCITAGTNDTNCPYKKLENIRLLFYAYNTLFYITDYQPSQLITANVTFILNFTLFPFESMTEYVNSREKITEAHTTALKNFKNSSINDRIRYDAIFKLHENFGNNIILGNYDLVEILEDFQLNLEVAEKTNLTTKTEIPLGHVGVKFATGELWKGASGVHWIFPRTIPQISVIKISNIFPFLDCYDLTEKLHTSIHNLKKYMKIHNGFVYYARPNTTELFYGVDEKLARAMHSLLMLFGITCITVVMIINCKTY